MRRRVVPLRRVLEPKGDLGRHSKMHEILGVNYHFWVARTSIHDASVTCTSFPCISDIILPCRRIFRPHKPYHRSTCEEMLARPRYRSNMVLIQRNLQSIRFQFRSISHCSPRLSSPLSRLFHDCKQAYWPASSTSLSLSFRVASRKIFTLIR